MKKSIAKKWAKALRSGKYDQYTATVVLDLLYLSEGLPYNLMYLRLLVDGWAGITNSFYYTDIQGCYRSLTDYSYGFERHFKTGEKPYTPTHKEFADWLDKYWWAL